jgi:serine/threonine protein kinase
VTLPASTLDHLRAVAAHPEVPERYDLEELIGHGGMGEVWRAHDRLLERKVAVKVLSAALPDPEFSARLEREARILARLEHPGIVAVYDVGSLPDGRAFYVMRLVRGERLDSYATPERPLGEVLRTFARVVEPVAYAHAHGILHRDLKPSNVMLGPFGDVLVMDWGVARVLGAGSGAAAGKAVGDAQGTAWREGQSFDQPTLPGTVLGTPGFMSPEQAVGGEVDERSDVFGLGAILGALLERRGQPPRALAAIVRRATAADPVQRYPTAAALGEDVRAFLDGLPVAAYRAGLLERLGQFASRHRVAILLFSAYIVMRALILAFRGV